MNILVFFILLVITPSYSFTCPSIEEIKSGHFNGWLPLYIHNEELASFQDVNNFKNNVTNFLIAKWSTYYLEYGHCFYQGTNEAIDKIIFAKDAWRPGQNNWLWQVANHLAECRGLIDQCDFVE